jgi:AraC family transcriptional regulator
MRAVSYIEDSLGEPIDLDSVCQRAHLSKYYFSRIFQAMVGETVFDYLRKRRLAEIAHRLVTTTEAITDLALRYGYESQQSMTKAFRTQYGVTPGAYRRAGRDRYFFHRARLSPETILDLHRDFSLRAHVFRLPAMRLVGLRKSMPITDPAPVERTRELFRRRAPELRSIRRHRGVFEVTLMRREQLVTYSPQDYFDGFIGFAVDHSATAPQNWAEMRIPESRYLAFHYTGADSIGRLSSLYRYIFSSGLALRRERLADRDFFHYYRPQSASMLFFLPMETPAE